MPVLDEIARESDAWIHRLGWQRDGHLYRYDPESGQDKTLQVALFCHGGFGLTWLGHLLGIPAEHMWASFFMHTSSISTILLDERHPDVATPRVIEFSALPHLAKAGLSASPAGMVANVY